MGSRFRNIQIGPGRPAKFLRIGKEKNPDGCTVRKNFPGDNKTVAPVVSSATEDDKFSARDSDFPLQNSRGSQTGVLHQDFLRNGKMFNGISVHGTHFLNAA
jgi:hypothetical protein